VYTASLSRNFKREHIIQGILLHNYLDGHCACTIISYYLLDDVFELYINLLAAHDSAASFLSSVAHLLSQLFTHLAFVVKSVGGLLIAINANVMSSQDEQARGTAVTITHTDYTTVYQEPTAELNGRQNDGQWTPEVTWAPAPSVSSVPVWTPEVQPTVALKVPGESFDNGNYGMAIALGVLGTFVGLSLIGCTIFAIKRKKACFRWFSGSNLKKGKKVFACSDPCRDVEAGHDAGSDGSITPPPRVVVNPSACPTCF
jgi:hypothetical protein